MTREELKAEIERLKLEINQLNTKIGHLQADKQELQKECIAASDQILKLMNQSCANEQQGSCRGFKETFTQ